MNIWIDNAQLASALLKGSGLLLVTALAVCMMRKASAASQFRVCFVGLCMSLLVAVASTVASMSNLEYSLLQSQAGPREDSPRLNSTASLAVERPHEFRHTDQHTDQPGLVQGTISSPQHFNPLAWPPSPGDPAITTELALPQQVALNGTPEAQLQPASGNPWMLPFAHYWPILWATGAMLVFTRLLVHYCLSNNASRRFEKLTDPALLHMSNNLARQLHLPSPALCLCSESITPFVVGLWQPGIILPADARNWSDQRLTFVLLHEMAHIKRRDLLTQFLAGLVVAVNWFNPLSWLLFSQMMRLRELACDDFVLLQDQQPVSYAETLLEVAAGYRSMNPAHGIAMAGKLDLARRIHCALDGSRVRVPFGRRTLFSAIALALIVCLVIGTIQLQARATEPQDQAGASASQYTVTSETKNTEITAAPKSDGAISEEARSMLVRVLDEQSEPLAGVDIWVTGIDHERHDQSANLPRIHYHTDATGTAVIKFRKGQLILQLWPSLRGYVPQFVAWDEKKLTLPPEYTFHFEKGERLAGRIIDATGSPIENARVQVRTNGAVALNQRAQKSSPLARCNSWLAFGDLAARSNAAGEWEILNAPSLARNPQLRFDLLLDHPDFAGDRAWGGYQARQGITSDQLRAGSATIVMERGAVLRGKITATNGAPVTKGLVIWVADPYFATGINEAPIQLDGTFQLPNLHPGKYPITVLAPGFAPEQKEVDISESTPSCDFQLQPGNPIRIEIIDSAGNAIPNAIVSIAGNSWRRTSAIYNTNHPDVPPSGIPGAANENGVYQWDWAPADAVKYSISKSGYDSKSVSLVAQAESHRVVLAAPIRISGSVVDAQTGNPITEFRVMPVKAFRPDFYSTDFQEDNIVIGRNGRYEIRIDSHGESTNRHRVRIEASGYRSALGRLSVAAGEPALVENFRLERAEPLVGRVSSPDGSPANQFDVAIGAATTNPQFDFKRLNTDFGQGFKINGQSTFQVAASFEPQRLRIFNDEGFAEVLVQPDQDHIGEVLLQPHTNVSGRFMQGDIPIGNEFVCFRQLAYRSLSEARFQDVFFTTTDTEGNFDFGRLPPIAGSVVNYFRLRNDRHFTSSHSIPLNLRPGEHRQIVLSGEGVAVTGRVIARGRTSGQFTMQTSAIRLISHKQGVPLPAEYKPLSIQSSSGPVENAWLQHSDFSAWLLTKEHHSAELEDDGSFKFHGVEPGEYSLVIQLYDETPGCWPVGAVGSKIVPVVLTPEQIRTGELNLEAIEVECRPSLQPGADMRAIQFVNAAGQVVSVDDFGGQHVLLHVWASGCEPCVDSLPQLKADLAQLQETPFTAVGINIDGIKSQGQTTADRLQLHWTQTFAGEGSDLARQLRLSSIPAYYLIGPDGKLEASSGDWKEIRQLLKEQLKPSL